MPRGNIRNDKLSTRLLSTPPFLRTNLITLVRLCPPCLAARKTPATQASEVIKSRHPHFQSHNKASKERRVLENRFPQLFARLVPPHIVGPLHQPLCPFAVPYHPIVNISSLFQGVSLTASIITDLRICPLHLWLPVRAFGKDGVIHPRNDELGLRSLESLPLFLQRGSTHLLQLCGRARYDPKSS